MTSVKDDIDLVSRHSGYGNLTEAATNAVFGLNHRGVGNPIPYNTDNHGLTFFTRPRLNLSYDNVAMDRRLTPLLTEEKLSYQRAIRTILDPIGAYSRGVTTPLVDHKSPFIALLTNNLLSLSGWPDPTVGFFNSKEGPAKESWSMIDDVSRNFGTFDLQASFRNIAGDPITLLFNTWLIYATRVYDGLMMPYPDAIIENEIDYMTRIYRLVLDPSRQYVQKIAACGAAFPTSSALGAAFNFSSDTPFNQDNAQQISIPIHCIGCDYQDPILVKEFNDIGCLFNNDLYAALGAPSSAMEAGNMRRLAPEELSLFNYYGYPLIHPASHKLSWWVYMDDYKRLSVKPLTPVSSTNKTTTATVSPPQGRGYSDTTKTTETSDPNNPGGP